MSDIYNKKFYSKHLADSKNSAKIIVPHILNVFPVQSVMDVGCGKAAWLKVFQQMGVNNVHGWDINNMDGGDYEISKNKIRFGCDFSSLDFKIDNSADICISLEVAEHLPEKSADNFVLNLINSSQVIIFSAAYPGQTGVNHINEQPPWYWRNKFNRQGYLELDFLRPLIWKNENVSWWYRQNITSYVHPEYFKKNPAALALFNEFGQRNGTHRLTLVNEWILEKQGKDRFPMDNNRCSPRLGGKEYNSNTNSSEKQLIRDLADHLLKLPLPANENRLIADVFSKYDYMSISNMFVARSQSDAKVLPTPNKAYEFKEDVNSTQIPYVASSNSCEDQDDKSNGTSFLDKIPSHLSSREKKQLHRLAQSKARDGAVFVELGSYLGGSSCYIADAIKSSQANACLYCVDTWFNEGMTEGLRDTYGEFANNIKIFQDIIVPLRGKTDQVVNYFNKKIDFLFIDADHSYQGVSQDIINWLPLLKPDAIIAFHDYTWFDGVKRAIQENLKPVEAQPGILTDSLYHTSVDTSRIKKQAGKTKLLFVMPALERIYHYNPSPYAYEPHSKLMPNVSGLFIGSYLQKFDIKVNLFDFVEYYKKDCNISREKIWQYLKTRIDLFSPDVIAMNAWPQTIDICSHFTKRIKQSFPNIKVIWGGHFVTLASEKELMATPADLFIKYGGEIPLQKILSGTPITSVENVLYRSPDGLVSTNEKIFSDLNYELDLDWSLLDTDTYFKPAMDLEAGLLANTAMVIFNRGCPHRCNFCIAQNGTFPKPVWITNQSLSQEVNKLYKQYAVEHIHVADDLTFRNNRNLESFIQTFPKTEAFGKVKFTISTRADRLKDRKYLNNLEKVGVVSVRVGVESDSETILKKMDKRSSTVYNRTILHNSYTSSIKHIFMMINGYLDETRRDAVQSIRYLMRNLNMNSRFWVSEYQLYRGTHDYLNNSHKLNWNNFTSMSKHQASRYDRFMRDIESEHNIRFSIKSLVDVYCKNNSQIQKMMELSFISKPSNYFYDLSIDPNFFIEQNRLFRKYISLRRFSNELRYEFHDTLLMLYLSKRPKKLRRLIDKHGDYIGRNAHLLELIVKLLFYNGELRESVALIDKFASKNRSLTNMRKFIIGFEAFARQHRQYLLSENIPFLNKKASRPYLSVIIPTRDRAALLEKALKSLSTQTYPQELFEVIIIDNGSSDNTARICKQYSGNFQNYKYVYEQNPGLHNGRHRGMKEASGDILVYGDDDISAFPTWLEGVADGFSRDNVAMVGGKILPKLECEAPEWYDNIWEHCRWGKWLGWYSILDFGDAITDIPAHYIWGCNFSIRKDILIEVGGFNPDSFPEHLLKYRGDGETAVSVAVEKRGYKAIYHPDASVYHWVSEERLKPDYLYKRAFAQGISDSFTAIRQGQELGANKELPSRHNEIRDVIQNGYCNGFNYHQKEVGKDPWLFKWVNRKSFLNDSSNKNDIEVLSRRLVQQPVSN